MIGCGAGDDKELVPSAPIPPLGSIDRFYIDHMFSWEMEASYRIPTRELSFTRLIPDQFTQLPALLSRASSTSDHTQVGFYGIKRLRLSRKVIPPKAWKDYSDECKAANEELKYRSGISSEPWMRVCGLTMFFSPHI